VLLTLSMMLIPINQASDILPMYQL